MSKRTRGGTRTQHRRPGTRPASSRPAGRQREATERRQRVDEALLLDDALAVEALTAGDGAEAAAMERDHPGREASTAARAARTARAHHRLKPGSLLATRAATEYVYVAQDLKRIALVGAVLFGALIVLWLLIVVLRVIPLPFY